MMPAEAVAAPLAALLDGVLSGLRRDITGELGTAVSIAHPAARRRPGQLRVLAATGIGQVLTPITTKELWGPSLLVAADEGPVVSQDLWHDPRWPHLTLDALSARVPEQDRDVLSRVRGVAALPSIWEDHGIVVVSAYLDQPADEHTLAILTRHERLVTSAVTIAEVANRSLTDADRVLDALASRAVIEQAKGAIMTVWRCDANAAWAALQQASQRSNVKLRALALGLVEHIGGAPAEQPDSIDRQVTADATARHAAAAFWQALNAVAASSTVTKQGTTTGSV
jgi:ANTAR domain-containing protein